MFAPTKTEPAANRWGVTGMSGEQVWFDHPIQNCGGWPDFYVWEQRHRRKSWEEDYNPNDDRYLRARYATEYKP
jgi:hypothetical protein